MLFRIYIKIPTAGCVCAGGRGFRYIYSMWPGLVCISWWTVKCFVFFLDTPFQENFLYMRWPVPKVYSYSFSELHSSVTCYNFSCFIFLLHILEHIVFNSFRFCGSNATLEPKTCFNSFLLHLLYQHWINSKNFKHQTQIKAVLVIQYICVCANVQNLLLLTKVLLLFFSMCMHMKVLWCCLDQGSPVDWLTANIPE